MEPFARIDGLRKELARAKSTQALETLLSMLADSDWEVRLLALDALLEVADPRAVEALLDVFRDKNRASLERGAAAVALARQGCSQIFDELLESLHDGNVGVRSAAAQALGELRDVRAVGPLIERLLHDKWDTRVNAAEALGMIGGEEATAALRQVSEDKAEEHMVRSAAAQALRGKPDWQE